MTKVSQILVPHFTTPFSSCLQRRIYNLAEQHNGAFFTKIINSFLLFTIFAKKLFRRCLTGLQTGFLLRNKILSLLLFPVYKLNRENTQSENMCDIVLKQKQPSEGSFKKDVMINFAEFTRKYMCRNLFFSVFL